ncbi:MAG: hypothetical protein GY938_22645, partial [Ketobacter sp.]|nr:hypothetical protein [Ketobacter sp.]
MSSDFEIFTSEHVGALVRLWEPGQATGISGEPVKDATVSNTSVFTTDSAVYGFNDLTGTTMWVEDWHAAKHKSGVVKISSLDGTDYFDQVYLHDISCVLKITAVTDAYTATVRVVKNHVPNSCITIGTHFWEMGSWNDFYGYPRVLAFHEQRLWAASSNGEPQTVWGSVTDGFEDFSDGSLDDSALSFQIASDKVDLVRWMDAGKTLVLGTVGSEYSISATEQGQGITPSNVKITRQTEYGSTRYEPVRVGHKVVFPQRHGLNSNSAKKLREYGYSFEQDNYLADDLTIISEQITGTGIQELCYQAEPNNLIWSNRDDGQAVVCTYQRAQD